MSGDQCVLTKRDKHMQTTADMTHDMCKSFAANTGCSDRVGLLSFCLSKMFFRIAASVKKGPGDFSYNDSA